MVGVTRASTNCGGDSGLPYSMGGGGEGGSCGKGFTTLQASHQVCIWYVYGKVL